MCIAIVGLTGYSYTFNLSPPLVADVLPDINYKFNSAAGVLYSAFSSLRDMCSGSSALVHRVSSGEANENHVAH